MIGMRMKKAGPQTLSNHLGARSLTALVLALAAGSTGCFRAGGIQRASATATEIPAEGGDRVHGNKAAAGPGDFYIGNDFVEIAVDGALFGDRAAVAGAAAGGSIIDAGYIELDTSFHRVSMPADLLERLTPVVNLDPDIELVFDRMTPSSENGASLSMEGGILDPHHRIAGATHDGRGRVQGVTVTHLITLGKSDRFFTLSTTVTNSTGMALGIRNLGDYLHQPHNGFRAIIPATTRLDGTPVSNWGVDFPGTDMSAPLANSVVAPMVAFMGSEPGSPVGDNHVSLGITAADGSSLVVASDPQAALTETRPRFVQRVVAGGTPVNALGSGESLTFVRRLFVTGGSSISPSRPAESTGVVNQILANRSTHHNNDTGLVVFNTFGTAAPNGALRAEIRFERNNPADGTWSLERVDWREPSDNLPAIGNNINQTSALLPVGDYRISIRNQDQSFVLDKYTNTNSSTGSDLALPLLKVEKSQAFILLQNIAPERGEVVSASGSLFANKTTPHIFTTRMADGTTFDFQPMRFTFSGVGPTPDPIHPRARSLGSTYSAVLRSEFVSGANFGSYSFSAGNTAFGSAFKTYAPLVTHFAPGKFTVYGTRGPLSRLEQIPLQAFDGQTSDFHSFIIFQAPLPSGWTTFDLPGPSQITTGGMLPVEQLSSGLAEQIQVIGRTDLDRQVSVTNLRRDFMHEFQLPGTKEAYRAPLNGGPVLVPCRSSDLAGHGTATALWTPEATRDRAGGARPSTGWNLADFLTQAEGQFNVIHRPRGPQGLFTQKGFDPATPLGTGANAWWNVTGVNSLGKTNGGFNALELLRAEGLNGANPDAWFTEFKAVRADWYALLKQQTPAAFTKALGLSSGIYSQDTPVGLARTYLKIGTATPTQADQSAILATLHSGAAVASTGPLLDVTVNGAGPGSLATAPGGTVTLTVNLYAPSWVPVQEVRILVNGVVVQTLDPATFTPGTDFRLRSTTVDLSAALTKDAFIVVEAGVPLATTGAYAPGTPWAAVMKGIYPIAVTNPVFVDFDGGGYTAPGLP